MICHKKQYKEASFMEKIKLSLHLFICKTCSGFSRKNAELTALCDKAPLHCISEKDKVIMKKGLRDKF